MESISIDNISLSDSKAKSLMNALILPTVDDFLRFVTDKSLEIKFIKEIDILREEIDALKFSHESRLPNNVEKISQLAELRDKGIVTDLEFNAKKAELLSSL